MKKSNKNNNGFSHFELILSIIVIAVIASVGFFVYNKNNNKSKADSALLSSSKVVSCKVTGVISNPSYGSVQNPVVTIYNKSGRAFSGELLVQLQLNNNGDGATYNIKTGNIMNGYIKRLKLQSFTVPYADSISSSFGPLSTAVGVKYNDPLPPNKRSFSCSTKFTLPTKPITVYRYKLAYMDQWILDTDPNLSKNSDYKGFSIESGKEFKAFNKNVAGTKPVYALLYPNGVVYSNKTDEIANCKEPNCRKGDVALFYAYENETTDRIPIYSVKRIYSPSNDMIIFYTPDLSEAQKYQKNYGFEVTTAFWAQK